MAGSYFCQGDGSPSDFQMHTYTHTFINILDMIAIIGTSDQPCWLAEACKILLLLIEQVDSFKYLGLHFHKPGDIVHLIKPIQHKAAGSWAAVQRRHSLL